MHRLALVVGMPVLSLVLMTFASFTPAGRAVADDGTAAVDPEAVKNLEAAYPRPPAGRERHVVLLPHKTREEEGDFRVEVVVGRSIETDGVNRYRFGGTLEERDIPGWGFSYYDAVGNLDAPLSTRIAAGDEPRERRFVPGPRLLVPYNSRLPLVVMTPAGCEVRWRVWRADGALEPAPTR